ncbi:hypothetical protein Pan97_11100 [Bremerella volcania]|uniref:Uncharacterized protein n=1 Tax=Bremerella volcania TaxID=2527984 RepID=A0A518C4F6_9BACT|nr:hypothetical protein [Bremerella volcania]QDU74105.1 hypothetical protein Pan97_11100 [Bremerella volcania]
MSSKENHNGDESSNEDKPSNSPNEACADNEQDIPPAFLIRPQSMQCGDDLGGIVSPEMSLPPEDLLNFKKRFLP